MVSRSTTSTCRKPLSARFFSSSHPIPPDPIRSMRQDRISESRDSPSEASMPRRMGGQGGGGGGSLGVVASSSVILEVCV